MGRVICPGLHCIGGQENDEQRGSPSDESHRGRDYRGQEWGCREQGLAGGGRQTWAGDGTLWALACTHDGRSGGQQSHDVQGQRDVQERDV